MHFIINEREANCVYFNFFLGMNNFNYPNYHNYPTSLGMSQTNATLQELEWSPVCGIFYEQQISLICFKETKRMYQGLTAGTLRV